MTPPINIDGSEVTGITIDGTDVREVTVDGSRVFGIPVINRYDPREEASTGSISTIPDLTSSNFDLSGSASVISGGINGELTYRFDGTEVMDHTNTIATSEPFAIVFVAQQQEATDSNHFFLDGGSDSEFGLQDTNGNPYAVYRSGSKAGAVTSGSNDQNPHIYVLEGQNGGDIRFEKDGTTVNTFSASNTDLTGLAVGGRSSDLRLEVDFGQLETLQGHTDSELNSVRDRLADNWGITI